MIETPCDLSPPAAPRPAGLNGERPIVLIVDDTPDNLALLSDTLQGAGYAVLVALSGDAALKSLARATPDVVLMDAMMPGTDGFETCRRLKLDERLAALPVIFMTALTESEHVIQGFRVGGIDYVTKPVKPDEICARIAAHVQRARAQQYASALLDLEQRAALIATGEGSIRWLSPKAAQVLAQYPAATSATMPARLPDALAEWLANWIRGGRPAGAVFETRAGTARHVARVTGSPARGEWIVVLDTFDDDEQVKSLSAQFHITAREAQVLLWMARGKTNRDIGDILCISPRTVNKHLEHLFAKLHVETRSAATALVANAQSLKLTRAHTVLPGSLTGAPAA
ncbi:MAG TPA: response regulator [Paraburkholderia sp.]